MSHDFVRGQSVAETFFWHWGYTHDTVDMYVQFNISLTPAPFYQSQRAPTSFIFSCEFMIIIAIAQCNWIWQNKLILVFCKTKIISDYFHNRPQPVFY